MRIVHMSDIHVGRLPHSARALFDKRLLGTANHLLRRARRIHWEYVQRAFEAIHRLAPELVICTGDLTSVGSPEELAAASALLEPLRASFGSRFLFLPGNHDAYVNAPDCQAALARTFAYLNGGRWELSDLPVEWSVCGLRLILLDAARPMPCWLSSGRLAPPSAEWLAARLRCPRQEGECRVLLSHFPLRRANGQPLGRRRRLEGSELLWRHFDQGEIDLVLSGHVHAPFARWEADGRGEVCAGSLTLAGSFSVLEWMPGTRRFRQWFADVRTAQEPELPTLDRSLAPVS